MTNVIRAAGVELTGNANYFECVDLALDLSLAREGEIEVLRGGIKAAGFSGGRRTFPPNVYREGRKAIARGASACTR